MAYVTDIRKYGLNDCIRLLGDNAFNPHGVALLTKRISELTQRQSQERENLINCLKNLVYTTQRIPGFVGQDAVRSIAMAQLLIAQIEDDNEH